MRLAYAITIHKSQGSEYKFALIVISNEHIRMLGRNILYTAVTRCKKCMIMVGNKSAIQKSVENNQNSIRLSNITNLLVLASR